MQLMRIVTIFFDFIVLNELRRKRTMNPKIAFSPQKLPLNRFQINIEKQTMKLLEASKKLTEVMCTIRTTKLPPTFFMVQSLDEAVSSTRIEGTRVELTEMLEHNIEKKDKQKASDDIQETKNYLEALHMIKTELDDHGFSERFIKSMHRIVLAHNVRGGQKDAGEYRRLQVCVGNDYMPPISSLIPDYMSNLFNYINGVYEPGVLEETKDFDKNLPPLIKTAVIHAHFETIHPFLDGNGRTGRILIPAYLYYRREISHPNLFFLSKTLEKSKYLYYDRLNGTRKDADGEGWNLWIDYFLTSVVKHCDMQIRVLTLASELYEELCTDIERKYNSVRIKKVIDYAFSSPILTRQSTAINLGLSKSTATKYINVLVENNILTPDSKARNKRYYFYPIIELVEQVNI